ncbi:MAG: hypothetical protein LBK58_08760 [Prevotellaceae bacterium]|jgi:hypothetical protein|nr:hypothetical protein [Prevotellaceae bacterium]
MLTDRDILEIERNTDYDVFNSRDGKIVAVNRNRLGEDTHIRIYEMQTDDIINYLILCAEWSEKDSTAGTLKTLKTSLKN